MSQANKPLRVLSVFSLTMITVGSVDSIRNLPTTALFGSQLILFFILGAIFFLIPAALVSAELASGWPKQGGVYVWVREAFGKPMGFFAIWLQWIENVIWYPAILFFVGGTIGYFISPTLMNDTHFLCLVIVSAFWAVTFINCCGMQVSAFFATLCTIFGLLVPMGLIISLGVFWVLDGNVMQIHFTKQSLTPVWSDPSMWASLTAVVLSYCGVEIATVHANDVQNPQEAFPKSLAYSVLIIVSTLILGSLAIAVVLPASEINVVAGIMQTTHMIFERYHLLFLMPVMAGMLAIGALGSVNNWIIAPTKGLLIAAEEGSLPAVFRRVNQKGAPVNMLIGQAVIVTLLASLVLYFPSVNGAYWFLTSLTAQLYMMMYLLMFATVLRLRWLSPDHPRAFRISKGWGGVVCVSLMGMLGAGGTFIVSFFPPPGINVGPLMRYESMLMAGVIGLSLLPFLMSWAEGFYLQRFRVTQAV